MTPLWLPKLKLPKRTMAMARHVIPPRCAELPFMPIKPSRHALWVQALKLRRRLVTAGQHVGDARNPSGQIQALDLCTSSRSQQGCAGRLMGTRGRPTLTEDLQERWDERPGYR